MIVTGATVLAYYLIEGDQTEDVVRVREEDPEWAAPELWRSELMNVLWKHVHRGDFDLDLALARFDLALDLIGPHTYAVTAAEVLPLAVASGCTAYDSQYVALARRLGVRLVTSDRPMLKAFPDVAMHPKDFTPVTDAPSASQAPLYIYILRPPPPRTHPPWGCPILFRFYKKAESSYLLIRTTRISSEVSKSPAWWFSNVQ